MNDETREAFLRRTAGFQQEARHILNRVSESDISAPAARPSYALRDRLSDDDLANLMALAKAVSSVVRYDRGRLVGHGWEELVEAYDAYWQERAHPLDDELLDFV